MASTTSFLNILTPFFPSNTSSSSSSTTTTKFTTLTTTTATTSPTLSITPSKAHEKGPILAQNEGSTSEIMGVVCPSLAYSNTLFFHSGYNVQVMVDDNEPEERLIGRFRREVMRAGVIQECKRRRHFENKQDKEKRKSREAAKRNSRRRRGPMSRGPFQNREEATKVEKKDDDGDNWEMPEGDSPF